MGDQGLLDSDAMLASGQKGLEVRNSRNDDSKDNNKDSYFEIRMLHFLWSFNFLFLPFFCQFSLSIERGGFTQASVTSLNDHFPVPYTESAPFLINARTLLYLEALVDFRRLPSLRGSLAKIEGY